MKRILMVAVGAMAGMAIANEVTPVMMPERLDVGNVNVLPLQPIDSAAWIWGRGEANAMLFRRRFTSGRETVRIHVSADNRYTLKLDGVRIARGPERGLVQRWTYRSLDLHLDAGEHVLEATVIRLCETFHNNVKGDNKPPVPGAPLAQLYWWASPGFILKAEGAFDAKLTTGKADWKACAFGNVAMADERGGSFGIGGSNVITGDSPWHANPDDSKFGPVHVVRRQIFPNSYGCRQNGWWLYPTSLPPQVDSVCTPGRIRALAKNGSKDYVYRAEDAADSMPNVIPPNTELNILWDMENYYCAYPELEIAGGRGSCVQLGWSEALKDAKINRKGMRDEFVGKRIFCFNDVFYPDGGVNGFSTTWWRAGRWLRLLVKTADQPLEIRKFAISEVRYPTAFAAKFECDDKSLDAVQRICERTLQMCSHEMSFDCPYYEQQMYPGDTRVQLQIHSVLSADDRLVRRDIELFDFSRREDGSVGFNFPTTLEQDGWSYTFMWPMMLGDYVMWRDNREWLRYRMPGLLHTMEGLRNFENERGLVVNLAGWNFHDWSQWPKSGSYGGCADANGTNVINNLLYVYALKSAATVADALGEGNYANEFRSRAARTSRAIVEVFWDDARGMLSEDTARSSHSEHAQSMALILDVLPPDKAALAAKNLIEAKDLVRTTVYFSHYLFEAYAKIGRADLILKRMDLWRGYVAKNLKTAQEAPDGGKNGQQESRSDCHAWSSHPLYHLHVNILGLKPNEPFFKTVKIAPQPGGLKFIKARSPTPKGIVKSDLRFENGGVGGRVTLPEGMSGVFVWRGESRPLHPGENEIN